MTINMISRTRCLQAGGALEARVYLLPEASEDGQRLETQLHQHRYQVRVISADHLMG